MTASKRSLSTFMIPVWMTHAHPVYDLEVRRRTDNSALRMMRLGCVPAILAGATLALTLILGITFFGQIQYSLSWYSFTSLLAVMLGWTIATLMLLQVGAGALVNILVIAQMAPTISGEIELQSWRLLRTTTLTLRGIIFAKFAAALRQIRGPLLGLLILRAASMITILVFSANVLLRDIFYGMDSSAWGRFWQEALWLPPLIAYVSCTIFYVSQPFVQPILNGAIGMLASVYSSTRAQAIAAALVGRLAVWVAAIIIHVGVGLGLIYLHSQWAEAPYASFDAYKNMPTPSDFAQMWVLCLLIAGYALSTLIAQLGMIAAALGLSVRRARQLGV